MTTLHVANNYDITIQLTKNDFHFAIDDLFSMAMRVNEKRRFLFVSKVLGKHLALQPTIPLLTARLLAMQVAGCSVAEGQPIAQALKEPMHAAAIYERFKNKRYELAQPVRIIGFAETATALGHGFFECFSGDVQYVHTTREQLIETAPLITFEEEHSHASTHRLYGDTQFFVDGAHIILVDDEMTTGQTNVNIIEQLHTRFPNITHYTLVSILDWRNAEQLAMMEALATKRGITIERAALVQGEIAVTTRAPLPAPIAWTVQEKPYCAPIQHISATQALRTLASVDETGERTNGHYLQYSGRFTLTAAEQQQLEQQIAEFADVLRPLQQGTSCLVIGTGEFMYVPMKMATLLGPNVRFHATTRSPIYPHEATIITERLQFDSIEKPGVVNYLYNVPAQAYDTIFIVAERLLQQEAAQALARQLAVKCDNIHIITF